MPSDDAAALSPACRIPVTIRGHNDPICAGTLKRLQGKEVNVADTTKIEDKAERKKLKRAARKKAAPKAKRTDAARLARRGRSRRWPAASRSGNEQRQLIRVQPSQRARLPGNPLHADGRSRGCDYCSVSPLAEPQASQGPSPRAASGRGELPCPANCLPASPSTS